MTYRPDIVIRDRDDNPVVVVEVKNLPGLSWAEAAQLRRNLHVYGGIRKAPFFLVFSQDRGFLRRDADESLDAPPDAEFPVAEVVRRYLPWRRAAEHVRGSLLKRPSVSGCAI